MNMQSITRGDILEPCDVCERMQFDVQLVNTGGIEPWTWDSLMVCGACRFTEAIEQAKYEAMIERTYAEEAAWRATHCECNGGDPCDCPDCDHADCSFRDPVCTCDAVIPPACRDEVSSAHELHCPCYQSDEDYMKGMTEDEYADWQDSMRKSVADIHVDAIHDSTNKYSD